MKSKQPLRENFGDSGGAAPMQRHQPNTGESLAAFGKTEESPAVSPKGDVWTVAIALYLREQHLVRIFGLPPSSRWEQYRLFKVE